MENNKKSISQVKSDPWKLEDGDGTDISEVEIAGLKANQLNLPDALIKLRDNLIRLDSENSIDMLVGDSFISIQKGIKRVYCTPTYRTGEYWQKVSILGNLKYFLIDIADQNMGSFRELKGAYLWTIFDTEKYDQYCQDCCISPRDFLVASSGNLHYKICSPKPLDENPFISINKEDVSIARELSKPLQFMNFNENYIDSQLLNGFQSLVGDCFVSIYRDVKQLHFIPREVLCDQRLNEIRYPDWDNVVMWMLSKGIGEFKEDKKGLIWWVYDKDAYDNLCSGPEIIWWAKNRRERAGYKHFKDEYKISRTGDNRNGR